MTLVSTCKNVTTDIGRAAFGESRPGSENLVKRVLALTVGDSSAPSSFYRFYQFVEPLRKLGIQLEIIPAKTFAAWDRLADFDLVVVQKKLLSIGQVKKLARRARRLCYDVDDAIWHPQSRRHSWLTELRSRWRLRTVVQKAQLCTTANHVLADYLKRLTNRVEVLPMALDEKLWCARGVRAGQRVRIGWAGHPVNLIYLEQIEPALVSIQEQFPNTEFIVFSGEPPKFSRLKYELVPYKAGSEPEVIRGFDIGLLPLPEGGFSEGKSPIKALQYMACGLPIVASPRGTTREMLDGRGCGFLASTTAEWIEALRQLISNVELRQRMGASARRTFEEQFSLSKVAPLYANCWRQIC